MFRPISNHPQVYLLSRSAINPFWKRESEYVEDRLRNSIWIESTMEITRATDNAVTALE